MMSLPTACPGSRSDSRAYGISALLCPGTRVMKFYLIVAKGKHKGMPIEIKVDLFLIGAKKICQLHSNKPGVGEEHCALVTRERKVFLFFFQAEDGIRVRNVTGVQTCALPILRWQRRAPTRCLTWGSRSLD